MKFGILALGMGCLGIAGCTVPEPTWTPVSTAAESSDQAYAQCQYEAAVATANPSAESTYKNLDEAIETGVTSGIDQADLIVKCMHARGFRQS
jgi:hypothetical protein